MSLSADKGNLAVYISFWSSWWIFFSLGKGFLSDNDYPNVNAYNNQRSINQTSFE